jgi:hypothetical protein
LQLVRQDRLMMMMKMKKKRLMTIPMTRKLMMTLGKKKRRSDLETCNSKFSIRLFFTIRK